MWWSGLSSSLIFLVPGWEIQILSPLVKKNQTFIFYFQVESDGYDHLSPPSWGYSSPYYLEISKFFF